MARKLKSDKVLFLATLLLVLASVVMVYSASAVMAMERFDRPYLFLVKQGMWAALGLALLGVVMRVDYRDVEAAGAHLGGARASVGLALVAVLFSAPDQRHAPLVRRRRLRHPAVGARQARRDLLHGGAARAAHAPVDEVRESLLPIGLVIGGMTALDPDRAGLRHLGVLWSPSPR